MKRYLWGFLIAVATQLQATDVVEVKLLGNLDCQKIEGAIAVVQNGDDQHSFLIPPVKTAPCTWHGTSPVTFDTRTAFFSLRLHGARTPIHYAEDPDDQSMAKLSFIYAPRSAFDIDVNFNALDTDGHPVTIDYGRKLRAGDKTKVEHPESGQLGFSTSYKVTDVNFRGEELRIYLSPKTQKDPGLLVNDVLMVKKRADFDHDRLVEALVHQAKGSKNRSAPNNDPPAGRTVYESLVSASGVTQIEFKRP